ncbi:MAG: ABC transporter substrate-binding protein [Planctomycetota bacterium]
MNVAQSYLWSGEPTELVEAVILKNVSNDEKENIQEHKTLLWKEISSSFGFRETSNRVMGLYWKNLPDEERREFEVIFTNHIKRSYIIGKTNSLFGKKIISMKEKSSNKFAKVQTELLTKTDKEVFSRFLFVQQKW